jgi:hypothetical protein
MGTFARWARVDLWCVVLSACDFPRPLDVPSLDAQSDTGPDAALDAAGGPDANACFGQSIGICLAEAPSKAIVIDLDTTIVTSDLSMCALVTSGGDYCVLAGTDITVNAKLRGTGSRPLILIASRSITTTAPYGLIDVGSHRVRPQGTPETGAGADSSSCDPGFFPQDNGGGAGGSFSGMGGIGGRGSGGNSGTPGNRVVDSNLPRGGCAGQDGRALGSAGGLGGHGGGAVYLIAGVKIDVQGGINAAGESGGRGIANGAGAGGGGSGGMIGFDAPTIVCNSLLLASGGGGGGGSGPGNDPGIDGQDPMTITAAGGGDGFVGNNAAGGDGGDGSAAIVAGPGALGTDSAHLTTGGGGGGGGAGLIKAPETANLGTNLSPPRFTLEEIQARR